MQPSTEYELLVKDIYDTLLKAEGFSDAKVLHNTHLTGKSGCSHQIDVYWEFNIAGTTLRVAIECKRFNQTVEVGWIRDFFGVLHDVGDVKGLFLTQTGFQSGAKKFAEHYNIDLLELRPPTPADWEGRVKDIHVNLHANFLNVTKRDFVWDEEWNHSHLPKGTEISIAGQENKIFVVDENGKSFGSLYDLTKNVPRSYEPSKGLQHKYEWPNAYIVSEGGIKVKLLALAINYDTVEEVQKILIQGDKIAKAILKNVRSGNIKFFDNKGNVRNLDNLPKPSPTTPQSP